MSKNKIRATKKVRELLVELDGHFENFHGTVRTLSDRTISNTESVNAGAEKMFHERMILACAWRINKASKGIKE